MQKPIEAIEGDGMELSVESDDKIVFAVFVSWTRSPGWRPAQDEYDRFRERVESMSPEAALFFGCYVTQSEVNYDAVMILRERLAVVREVKQCVWFASPSQQVRVVEPPKGKKLEEFVEEMQVYCSRGSTYGPRISVELGDEKTQGMLVGSDDRGWMSNLHQSIILYRRGLNVAVEVGPAAGN
ncbi:hypothetical protein V502_00608 [Pseudogymnoascus sp. VKM F-4520 (FW-2644)]|nr:hypothetical protein V502_00608 [Pseudogymnoascus sp. VKM F-4520 (FW-2644)]